MDQPSRQHSGHSKQRIADLLRQFQEAWKDARDVDLGRFLPPPGDALRAVVLRELVKADLQIRWQRRHGKPLESYVERLPELGNLGDLPTELLLEEYRARLQHGEPPELNSYRARFPRQFAAFEQQVREHPTQTHLQETAAVPAGEQPDAPGAPPQANQTFQAVGGYQMFKRLGQGSFAEVWKGVAPGGFPVAIKRILRPLEDDEAKRELESLERIKELRHPFLLQTHSSFVVNNHLFVVMELADGTLRDRQKECHENGTGMIPLMDLLRYFRESAEVLDYMHANHVLHRDIKPQNILLLGGHAKVADFGLATLQQSQRLMFTATGCGTPAYMAPEVWRGKVGPQSDQYSLAFAYAEQRLGKLPFKLLDLPSLMQSHLSEVPKLAPLPMGEQDVLIKALAKDPAERYDKCQDFVRALEKSLREQLRLADPTLQMEDSDRHTINAHSARLSGTLSPTGRMGQSGPDTMPMLTAGPQATWGQAPPKRSGRPWLLTGLLATVLLAVGAWFLVKELRPAFGLEATARLSVDAGKVGQVRVQLQRHRFDKPVQLTLEGLPPDCQAAAVTLSGDESNVDVPVLVSPFAKPGTVRLTLHATADADEQVSVIEIAIGKPAYSLPEGTHPAKDAKLLAVDGRAYYDKIDVVRDKITVPFLLIPKTNDSDPRTFYIMEDKVWVALFKQFAADAKDKGPENERWMTLPDSKEPENPVLGVTATDADRCADWLGGHLPMPAEWDKAAGRFDTAPGKGPPAPEWSREGPYQKGYGKKDKPEEFIKQAKPMKRGAAPKDVSPFGCRQMAWNGLEWTGMAASDDATEDSPTRATPEELAKAFWIVGRGNGLNVDHPLLFKEIKKAGGARPSSSPELIGFRVVLEP